MIKPQHTTPSGTHYICEGRGPALVFIHGAGGNAAVWFQQVEVFARSHRVICIDLPGFGLTPPREGGLVPNRLSEIVIEVLDHAKVERASIVGQSLGGWFALRMALAAPERVERLALSCSMGGVAHKPAMTAFAAALASLGPDGVAGLTLTDRFKREHPSKVLLFGQISASNPPLDPGAIGPLFAPDALVPEADLGRLRCPVLMLSGHDDPIWPPASLAGMIRLFADARQVVLQQTGHSPYFEKPGAFNSHLAAFLT